MSVKVYKNNQWHELEGAKIYSGTGFRTLKKTDKLFFAGKWYPLGDEPVVWMTTSKSGAFNISVQSAESFDMYIDMGDGATELMHVVGGYEYFGISHDYPDESQKEVRCAKMDLYKLKGIRCTGNQLTSMDISKNINLNSLDCGNNMLTSLNVRNNTLLYSLVCSNNQLTSLSVYANAQLGALVCSNNQLTDQGEDK